MSKSHEQSRLSIVGSPDQKRMEWEARTGFMQNDLRFLPVGCTSREPLKPYRNPCDVLSVDDLPARLYLGSLVPKTFSSSVTGWEVRYEDAEPGTYVELRYNAANGTLMARFVWQGIEGMSIFAAGRDWKALSRYMAMPIPENWADKLSTDLPARFDIQYTQPPENAPSIVAFPDGALMTVLFPVPSPKLPALLECLERIDSNTQITSPVAMTAALTYATVETGSDTNVGPINQDPLSSSNNGSGILCTGHWVYLAHLTCFFRDLTRVVECCRALEFVGTMTSHKADSHYPNGTASTASITPAGGRLGSGSIEIAVTGRKQRMIYREAFRIDQAQRLIAAGNLSRFAAQEKLRMAEIYLNKLSELTVSNRSTR